METHTKDTGDVSLAQVLMDAILESATHQITVTLDAAGTGFVITYPHASDRN